MSATTAKLLQAAAEILGSETALAQRLGVDESLLRRYLADRRELPDALLLTAVDIVLAERRANAARGKLPEVPDVTDNDARGGAAATTTPGGAP